MVFPHNVVRTIIEHKGEQCDPYSREDVCRNVEPPNKEEQMPVSCEQIKRENAEAKEYELPERKMGFHVCKLMVAKSTLNEKHPARFHDTGCLPYMIVFGWNLNFIRWATSTSDPRVVVIRSALFQY